MAGMITIACPGCEATFDIPQDLGGQLGECTECGTIFEIPVVEVAAPVQESAPPQVDAATQPAYEPTTQQQTMTSAPTQTQPPMPQTSPAVSQPPPQQSLSTTETGTIKGTIRDDISEATNTVKLSRTGVGMIPSVKDNFNFEVVKKPASEQTKSKTKTFKHTRRVTSGGRGGTKTRTAGKKTTPKPKKKWWQFWMFWKST